MLDDYLKQLGVSQGIDDQIAAESGKYSQDTVDKIAREVAGKINVGLDGAYKFTVKVVRQTADVAQDLQVPIFGILGYDADYDRELPLPSGITRTLGRSGFDVNISYNDGANTDIVTISATYPFASMIEATRSRLLRVRLHKYTVSPAANADEVFNAPVTLIKSKPFGAIEKDVFNPADKKSEVDNLANIVTVNNYPFDVNDERFFAVTMPQVESLQLSIYVEAIISRT